MGQVGRYGWFGLASSIASKDSNRRRIPESCESRESTFEFIYPNRRLSQRSPPAPPKSRALNTLQIPILLLTGRLLLLPPLSARLSIARHRSGRHLNPLSPAIPLAERTRLATDNLLQMRLLRREAMLQLTRKNHLLARHLRICH